MNYLIKTLEFFTYFQFKQELEELKREYYVTGYTVEPQKNKAKVRLVKKENKDA